jgi:hypothetical protein
LVLIVTLAAVVFGTGAERAMAQGCVSYDNTFNITCIAEANPFPPASGSTFSYGDLWSENGFVYLGSDRGFPRSGHVSNGAQGISIFSLSNAGIPTFLPPADPPPPGFQGTTYFGNEMEDVEVYDGIGYFGSDYNPSSLVDRTGVDIVDLSIPFDPLMLSRVDENDCLAGNPSVCAHSKVHTISIQRINENTPSEQRFMYTSDNETTTIKVTDVTNPSSPQLVASVSLLGIAGVDSSVDSHEVVVRNNRLFVASKDPGNTSGEGYVHIYDVSNPSSPVLLKGFLSGASTHTAMPTYDGNTLIVAEERSNGNVRIYDISMIDQPNDPQSPVLLSTMNRTSVGIQAHSPHHVHVYGKLLFLPWYEAGLQVFNISNPSSPVLVGAFDTWSGTSTNFNGNWGVDLSHGLSRVLISDRTRGLLVLDASGLVDPGDYNQDLTVNAEDYYEWAGTFGSKTISVHDAPLADGNFNGIVDAADYVVWRKFAYAAGSGGGQPSVPEPSAALLLTAGVAALALRVRGRRSV